MEAKVGLLYVAANGRGPELNGLSPEKKARGDVLSLQEEGGPHQVKCVTDPLEGVIMNVQEEVEDSERALDTRGLQSVITILAALVQVSPRL